MTSAATQQHVHERIWECIDKLCADFRRDLELHMLSIEHTLSETACERPITVTHKIVFKPREGEEKPFRSESTTDVKLSSAVTIRDAAFEQGQLKLL